jgi:PadR family transcriptional regulator, regulatory protein PadR
MEPKAEVIYGTLDLIVLKALDTLGPQHGFGIAQRIHQVSNRLLTLNEGTLYASLARLEQGGFIRSKWGTSENNRKARYYSITPAGQKRLAREIENWERMAEFMSRVLQGSFQE